MLKTRIVFAILPILSKIGIFCAKIGDFVANKTRKVLLCRLFDCGEKHEKCCEWLKYICGFEDDKSACTQINNKIFWLYALSVSVC